MSATFIDNDGKVKVRISIDGGTEQDGYIFIDSDGKTKMRVFVDGGSISPAPDTITTDMIQDGAVTDDKLATPKIDKPPSLTPGIVIGTTLETSDLGLVGYSQSPMADQLAMYQFGGQLATAPPQADGDAATKKYVDDAVAPKLTATKAAFQADSTATDVGGVVADLNALKAALVTAGLMASS